MLEILSTCSASSQNVLWDALARHQLHSAHGSWSQKPWGCEGWVLLVGCVKLLVPLGCLVGFEDSGILGVLGCSVQCGGGGMLWQHHPTQVWQDPCAGCGWVVAVICFSSLIL